MIDSHCHLDHCRDPRSAAAGGLRAMVTVGTTVARIHTSLELADELDRVWVAVGIHPNDASDMHDAGVRLEVEELALAPKVVAIGETGFDTHWDAETLASQRRAFDWQAELAMRLDLPLILHVRDRQGTADASREAAEALRAAGHGKGVLHCFNGNRELLEVGLGLGWMVSFAGNLTYPSAARLRETAREVPEDRLLVETDSPFLAPVPHRGKPNVPANVRHVAERLAAEREAPPEHIEEVTDRNAIGFYRLPI